MTQTPKTLLLKQLYYRSCHRGCKETDLLFGRFADNILSTLCEVELVAYEALLEEADSDIWQWFIAQKPVPETVDHGIWQKFKEANDLSH